MPLASAYKGAYQFGEFQLDLDLCVLMRSGRRVVLGSKAFDVLSCLIARAGEVVTKAELLASVWADAYVEEGTLAQQIFTLRKALGDRADYIVTVPGQGYRFMGAVRHVPTNVYDGREIVHEVKERTHMVIEEPMPAAVAIAAPSSTRSQLYALGAVAAITLAVAAGWFWVHRPAPPDHVSVVLADFSNTTGDATFDRTLRQALEIELEQSPFMQVLSEPDGEEALENMGQKPDTPMTASVAREVCERKNQQVLLTESISSVGDEYLLTVEATACPTGKRIASAKAQAASKTKVLTTLDGLAERVRSKLGESAKSIAGYDVPLEDAATPSLEALKVYSMGMHLQNLGKPFADSIPLFERAIELDPNFAFAYGELSFMYSNMGENHKAEELMQKCFDLRGKLGIKDKLLIQSHYEAGILKDWPKAIKSYETWATGDPDDWVPWIDAANLYTMMGDFTHAIPDAQRALQISHNVVILDDLGRAYKDTGRFAEAKAVVQLAASEGKDSTTMHGFLYEMAFDEGDAAALKREDLWLAAHKDSEHDYLAGEAAAMQGKYKLAEELFRHEVTTDRQDGLTELADAMAIEQAEMEREVGMTATARATLNALGKQVQDDPDFALQRTLAGDTSFGERYLAAHSHDAHPDTGVIHREVPEMRAALALQHGAAAEAVTDLAPPNTFEWPHVSVLSQRGQAELQAGQPERAATDFQFALDHPGSFFAVDRPLAHLGLARAYAAQKNETAARKEYETFLAAWKDADADLPVLKAAKAELAGLH